MAGRPARVPVGKQEIRGGISRPRIAGNRADSARSDLSALAGLREGDVRFG